MVNSGKSPASYVAGGVAAGVTFQALNYAAYIPVFWLKQRAGAIRLWRAGFQPFLAFHFFFLFVSLGLVHIFHFSRSGRWALLSLFLLPVLGLIYAFRSYSRERRLSRSLESTLLDAVKGFVDAINLKDNYTAAHSAAVALYAADIAKAMNLQARECTRAHLAGLMHDIGKIGLPDSILRKEGSLDRDEWEKVEAHSRDGSTIVGNLSMLTDISELVLNHHEKFDGTGYPQGSAGKIFHFSLEYSVLLIAIQRWSRTGPTAERY